MMPPVERGEEDASRKKRQKLFPRQRLERGRGTRQVAFSKKGEGGQRGRAGNWVRGGERGIPKSMTGGRIFDAPDRERERYRLLIQGEKNACIVLRRKVRRRSF